MPSRKTVCIAASISVVAGAAFLTPRASSRDLVMPFCYVTRRVCVQQAAAAGRGDDGDVCARCAVAQVAQRGDVRDVRRRVVGGSAPGVGTVVALSKAFGQVH